MLFNSHIFIFAFLPIALIVYFALNKLRQNTLAKFFLTCMSLWFYSYFHLSYLWIILFSIALNYICHILIKKNFYPKCTVACGILLNIGLLFYFKYFNFLIENINNLFSTGFSLPQVLMPLGISFFTFQQIAFLVDTKKGTVPKQALLDYALFVTFFPQLVAGPIVSHEEMLPQFQDTSKKSFCIENFYKGLRLFILGLSKKVLIADTFGKAVDWGFTYYTLLDGLNSFLVILFYTFQIYFDFSGYCDMARGIGYMFNIELPVNFNSPYKSSGIIEFWSRWHMTLTRFFTRYVYVPLGGNRKGLLRTCINVLIVFFISGFWHGAGWTFILWGLLHGGMNVANRLWKEGKKRLSFSFNQSSLFAKSCHAFSVLLTFLFVAMTWTFFRASSISQGWHMVRTAFSFTGSSVYLELASFFQLPEFFYPVKLLKLDTLPYASYLYLFLFMAAAIVFTFFCRNLQESEKDHKPGIFSSLYLSVLSVWCIISLSGVSSFLYFNF